LREVFHVYGEVTDVYLPKSHHTGRAQNFGFVTFADTQSARAALVETHTVLGREVEANAANQPREPVPAPPGAVLAVADPNIVPSPAASPRIPSHVTSSMSPGPVRLYMGGLPDGASADELCAHFTRFGVVTDVYLPKNHMTGALQPFGFVTMETDAAARDVLASAHTISGKPVSVNRADPKPSEAPVAPQPAAAHQSPPLNDALLGGGQLAGAPSSASPLLPKRGDCAAAQPAAGGSSNLAGFVRAPPLAQRTANSLPPRVASVEDMAASNGAAPGDGDERVHISNIPAGCTTEAVKIQFEQFGSVLDVYIPRNHVTGKPQPFGFVTFASKKGAYAALAAQGDLEGPYYGANGGGEPQAAYAHGNSGSFSYNPGAGGSRGNSGNFSYNPAATGGYQALPNSSADNSGLYSYNPGAASAAGVHAAGALIAHQRQIQTAKMLAHALQLGDVNAIAAAAAAAGAAAQQAAAYGSPGASPGAVIRMHAPNGLGGIYPLSHLAGSPYSSGYMHHLGSQPSPSHSLQLQQQQLLQQQHEAYAQQQQQPQQPQQSGTPHHMPPPEALARAYALLNGNANATGCEQSADASAASLAAAQRQLAALYGLPPAAFGGSLPPNPALGTWHSTPYVGMPNMAGAPAATAPGMLRPSPAARSRFEHGEGGGGAAQGGNGARREAQAKDGYSFLHDAAGGAGAGVEEGPLFVGGVGGLSPWSSPFSTAPGSMLGMRYDGPDGTIGMVRVPSHSDDLPAAPQPRASTAAAGGNGVLNGGPSGDARHYEVPMYSHFSHL
ncbi:hypothetical protein T492DRAFT_1091519, partial [Pavlovales sp. CCMP2436]